VTVSHLKSLRAADEADMGMGRERRHPVAEVSATATCSWQLGVVRVSGQHPHQPDEAVWKV
jgi:hypothetical protein